MDSDKGIQSQIRGLLVEQPALTETQPAAAERLSDVGTGQINDNAEKETQVVTKRKVKLTPKAYMEKLEMLQKERKSKLNKACNLQKTIRELMQNRGSKWEVQCSFMKYMRICKEAKESHDSLLPILPPEEKEKHDIWFKAKMINVNEFIDEVNAWTKSADVSNPVENVNEENVESEINPNDSISNVESKKSTQRSHTRSGTSRSSGSSTSSARKQAEAERAALVIQAAALKEKHALEEQEQLLKKKREMLELDTQLAAADAKIAVLKSPSHQALSLTQSDGMDSYFRKGTSLKEPSATLNPQTKEQQPPLQQSVAQQVPIQQTQPWQEQHLFLQQHHVSWNAAQDNSQENTRKPKNTKPLNKPEMDPPVQQTNHTSIYPQSSDETSAVCDLLQRQNEITALLVEQQTSHLLPPREIPCFDGDPLQYRTFVRAFVHCVEKNTRNKGDCLYFLEKYTRGQPKDLVRSCQHMPPDRGYDMARYLLEQHFGDEYKITAAYMEKVLSWPVVKSEDGKSLQAYALFLRECCNAMENVQYMRELNMPANMKTLILKLPYKLREKWRVSACDIMEQYNRRPQFTDIVTFIERQVKIVSDPVFGDIQNPPPNAGNKTVNRMKSQIKPRFKGDSFATTVTTIETPTFKHPTEPIQKQSNAFTNNTLCVCCSKNHTLDQCPHLEEKTHRDKIAFIRKKGICFGCLRIGHLSKDCEKRLTCKVCNQNHPSVLHINQKERASNTDPNQSRKPSTSNAVVSLQTCGQTGAGNSDGILSILPVQVKSSKGNKIIQTYAFLDPGSTDTFCSETLMRKLNLNGRKAQISLLTMGPKASVSSYLLKDLEIASLTGKQFYDLPKVYTQKRMPVSTSNIIKKEELAKWPYLDGVVLPRIQAEVELLIGTNASKLLEPWEVVNSHGDGPYAIKTLLGWVINGSLSDYSEERSESGYSAATVNRISITKLEELLNNQYNHDFNEQSSEEKEEMSRDDMKFMDIMKDSCKLQDGHYTLELPFKRKDVSLPNNQCVARQRILGLKRRFGRDEKFHREYTTFLNDVISKGYAECVPEHQVERPDGKVWYIPHHGVYHPKKGTLRVVFDCGAEYKGKSLNKELLQGPYLTSSLLGVLTRFRQEPVALMTDVQAMFHQVNVAQKDRDFLRFLWWPEGDTSQELVQYRMTVHLFGAVSSPSCACYALRKTAEDSQNSFSADVIDTVNRNFYMDDCLKSLPSEKEAIKMVKDLTAVCQKGGFHLTKWISNNREVLLSIPEEDRSKNLFELDLDRDQLPVERALGLHWCVETDTFKFKLALKEQPHTRRGILSMVSSIYDPLGFLSPLTLPAKLLLQDLCKRNYGWDDQIHPVLQQQWTKWFRDLEKVMSFQVERCLRPANFGDSVCGQLHHFCDASESGYGTVTYLRIWNNSNRCHVSFMLGKARVAPLKQVTIPRLELTAAVLAVRVDTMLRAEIQLQLEKSCFWTDSTSVLKYIKNEDKRFLTFVANRISAIRKTSSVSQWRYIHTTQNPADKASRGVKVDDLLTNRRWLEGPEFLWKPEDEWPFNSLEYDIPADDPEVKRELATNAVIVATPNATHQLISYFSDWKRLKRSVAWILKLRKTLLEMSQRRNQLSHENADKVEQEIQCIKAALGNQSLTPDDLWRAENAIIRFTQRQRFPDELAVLSSGKGEVKKNSPIYKLDPILEDGLLRVGGRLSRAAMSEESKHPVILAKDLHISTLILKYIHEQVGHGGRNHVLSKLRRKYWITSANAATRKILSDCVFCRRHRGKLGEQKMSDLPLERIVPDLPPFTNVGVDYFGPIEIKRGRSFEKRYGVIFTCMACRAVHLEVAYSLDTDSCINALRRFVCRRGPVTHLRSDNGTNFVGAEKELRKALAVLNHSKIQSAFLEEGIQWSFNPPAASHHGGAWERIIRMIRRTLTSVLHQQTLNDEGFLTVLCEVEAILNDRPITGLSGDLNDLEALTPNHILTMKRMPILPPGLFEKSDLYLKRRWRQVQYISDLFWKRWLREYLPLLQERQRWSKERQSLVPGDIVLIADPTAPRGSWLLGRVLETYPDRKGLVRSAQVKTKTSTLVRPVTKLCLLQEAAI